MTATGGRRPFLLSVSPGSSIQRQLVTFLSEEETDQTTVILFYFRSLFLFSNSFFFFLWSQYEKSTLSPGYLTHKSRISSTHSVPLYRLYRRGRHNIFDENGRPIYSQHVCTKYHLCQRKRKKEANPLTCPIINS